MLNKESLKKYIEELIKEVEEELDESTTTGAIAGYDTPAAFSDNSDATKRRKKKIATQLGMQLVGKVESVNEATASEIVKDLDKVRHDLIKKVDILIAKKKKLYSNVDIESPMSADEKQLDKDIQSIFSQIQQIIQQKRKIKESVNEGLKHFIHVGTPKEIVSKDVAKQIITLAKKGIRSNEIGLNMHFVGNEKAAVDAFQKVKNKVYFDLHKNESVNESVIAKDGKILSNGNLIGYYEFDRDSDSFWVDDVKKGKGQLSFDTKKEVEDYFKKNEKDALKHLGKLRESVNEGKSKGPVNRWLELKNDDSMHANKKLAVGLKELKYQLKEVETFFRWYNQIKTMNELDSNQYWKRTNSHIYKIKERIINIARTLQEIEK